jgi:hypothetical protein
VSGSDGSRPWLPAPALEDVIRRSVTVPPLTRVRRRTRPSGARTDAAELARVVLTDRLHAVSPGSTVALAVGSRGIADIADIVRAVVAEVRTRGASPFIVPAMGSHGGATAEGQQHVLAELGISEDAVGAPVESSMETVSLGRAGDVEVYVDRHAAGADHVLLVNRLKSHTSFSGAIESGLAKMLAIGLGKQRGAEELHRRGPAHLEARIQAAGRLLKASLPLLGGLAVVEGSDKSVHTIRFLGPDDIGADAETQLLALAKSQESRLPFEQLDVLVVDLMGKEISGTGMDTNVLGRRMVRGMPEPGGIDITNVVVLEVSRASEGNAVGIGLADFAPARALDSVELVATYGNALTAGLQGVQRAQLPIVLASDRDAVHAAVLSAGLEDVRHARMARVRSTLNLDELLISDNLLGECADRYEPVDADARGYGFSADGSAEPWPAHRPHHEEDK